MTFVNAHIRSKAQLVDGCFIETTKKKAKGTTSTKFMTIFFDTVLLKELGFSPEDKVLIMPGQEGDFGCLLLQPSKGRSGVKLRVYGARHLVVRVGAGNAAWNGYEMIQSRLPMHKIGKYEKGGIVFKIVGIQPDPPINEDGQEAISGSPQPEA